MLLCEYRPRVGVGADSGRPLEAQLPLGLLLLVMLVVVVMTSAPLLSACPWRNGMHCVTLTCEANFEDRL